MTVNLFLNNNFFSSDQTHQLTSESLYVYAKSLQKSKKNCVESYDGNIILRKVSEDKYKLLYTKSYNILQNYRKGEKICLCNSFPKVKKLNFGNNFNEGQEISLNPDNDNELIKSILGKSN